jgi:hypothetical protein
MKYIAATDNALDGLVAVNEDSDAMLLAMKPERVVLVGLPDGQTVRRVHHITEAAPAYGA